MISHIKNILDLSPKFYYLEQLDLQVRKESNWIMMSTLPIFPQILSDSGYCFIHHCSSLAELYASLCYASFNFTKADLLHPSIVISRNKVHIDCAPSQEMRCSHNYTYSNVKQMAFMLSSFIKRDRLWQYDDGYIKYQGRTSPYPLKYHIPNHWNPLHAVLCVEMGREDLLW